MQPPASLQLVDAVWGIDPSTLRVSIGMLLPTGAAPRVAWETCSLPKHRSDPGVWFALCLAELEPFFHGLVERYGRPLQVGVEEPFGGGGKSGDKKPRTVHPSSNRMLGVTLAALGRAVGQQTLTFLIQPNSWKRAAMGQGWGGAKPAQYLAWAQSVGYSGVLEDEAAGIGVATATGVLVERRRAA